jgi:hypothetical protein
MRSRTKVSLIGVPSKRKSSMSLGQRQLGDGDLILDRTRLLLADLGAQQIADHALRFVLALHCCGKISSNAALIP